MIQRLKLSVGRPKICPAYSHPRGYCGRNAASGDSGMNTRATAAVKPAPETGSQELRRAPRSSVRLTQQQLEHAQKASEVIPRDPRRAGNPRRGSCFDERKSLAG